MIPPSNQHNKHLEPSLARKYEALQQQVKNLGPPAVAFSGGVDSTLLLRVAADLYGGKCLALLADSVLQPAAELENGRLMAAETGARLLIEKIDPLARPEFVANPPDRCYGCKKVLYTRFLELAAQEGIAILLDGSNLDDLSEDRPGLRALHELGVHTPLAEAGLRKSEVRRLSRFLGLSNWARLSASCLATRIPAGSTITLEMLHKVMEYEDFLKDYGFRNFRVRLHYDAVHLELSESDMARMMMQSMRQAVLKFFYNKGLKKVFLDLSSRQGIVF